MSTLTLCLAVFAIAGWSGVAYWFWQHEKQADRAFEAESKISDHRIQQRAILTSRKITVTQLDSGNTSFTVKYDSRECPTCRAEFEGKAS